MLFAVLSVQAQVVKNKGPVFTAVKTDQKELIKDYMWFRVKNSARDLLKAERLGISYSKQLAFNQNFKLPFKPKLKFNTDKKDESQVIENRIADYYKDSETSEYNDFDFLKVSYGLCLGYTVTLRQFHYFASFDSSKAVNRDKRIYQKLIDQVFANKPTIIPGFKSLLELSQSEHGDYIKRHIADQWAVKNVNLEGLINWVLPLPRLTKGSIVKLKKEIDLFLSRNFEPIIMLYDDSALSSYAHVVRAIKTSSIDDNGCFELTFLDTDGSIKNKEICAGLLEQKIEIAPNESLEFTDYFWQLNGKS